MLGVIIRAERDKVTGVWRALIIEELNDLNSSPIIIRVIKARSVRWAGHLAHMEEKGDTYRERERKTQS
jgi:RNase P/RNase MRP subunit POP5